MNFIYILTVCDNAKEDCPVFFYTARRMHQNFKDPVVIDGPQEKQLASFRNVRDEIRSYLKSFPQQ